MAAPNTIDTAQLERHLLTHAGELRRYIATKIPPSLASVLSAEDVLQETWAAAFLRIRSFVPNGPQALDRWLITIANRKLLDALKALRRRKRHGAPRAVPDQRERSASLGGLLAQIAASRQTPSREVARQEATTALQSALADLCDDRRRAVVLRFIDGLSPKQIADRLGKSYAAVNSLLFQGLRELRVRLGHAARFFSDVRSVDTEAVQMSKVPPVLRE